MAGSPREVIPRLHRRRPVLLMAGLLLFTSLAMSREDRAGIVLLERPDRFILLNKYQQRLTTGEYRSLPSVMAALLVRETDRLSDGITMCTVVEYEGNLIYVQRESHGEFPRRGSGGNATFFRNAQVFNDTIVLLQGAALRLRPPGGTSTRTLPPGSHAVRLFSAGEQMFVRLVSPDPQSGWIALTGLLAGREWKVLREMRNVPASLEIATRRLAAVITGANRALKSVYTRLSRGKVDTTPPASFRLQAGGETLRCFVDPASSAHTYASSLAALLPEFERALTGTGLHPTLSGGQIVVPLR